MFILIERWTSILENIEGKVFPIKPRYKYHLSQWEECVYGAQSRKERRVLCESMFILIERRILILKIVEREVFPIKPKHQYHLSQWKECVYSAQSWKEKRLLSESMFISIETRTSILKMVE